MTSPPACLIGIDTGTTNTRVWFLNGAEVVAASRVGVGVRDTAREGSPRLLHEALQRSIAEVRAAARANGIAVTPAAVIAAGMITSPLGLKEVPHLPAPAGGRELAMGLHVCHLPGITDLPIWLVPGVRTGPDRVAPDGLEGLEAIDSTDVMRGEETLAIGLVSIGRLSPGSTLLNLGSHWKVVRLDAESRIASSVTSLSGELIHAAQTQTILASSVPNARATLIHERWLRAGMAESRRAGVARALFCVRLLEQRCESTPDERLSYLIGACLAADLDAMTARNLLPLDRPVVVAGGEAVAGAVALALAERSIRTIILTETEIEAGLLAGLRAVAGAARPD
ncbi:MAG: 2-dehydro-3-deoxygalactonokinase [Acidobacteria bacterium]|nr:2-dehydro-3-deoxygalactonokinase [Acidobacteriota bacterium]